jgi:O-antigen ligase
MGILFYNAGFAKSLLYWMKYMEYFFLFFLVAHNLRDLRQAHVLILAQIITCLISGLYGYSLMMQGVGRVYAPFDPGEANTYGGYLVLMFAIMISFILYADRKQLQLGMLAAIFVLLPPFLFTLSRSSYVAIVGAVIAHLFLYHRRRYLAGVLVMLALMFIFIPDLVPVEIKQRVAQTIDIPSKQRVAVMGITFDSSFSQRLISWQQVLDKWTEYPLFGKGVTNFGFVDGQYFSHLIDLGLVGFGAFILLLGVIIQTLLRELKNPVDLFHKSLLTGLLAAFIGLLIHAIGGNTFIIIRIMEPFWFMMGIALSYRRLYEMGTPLHAGQTGFIIPTHYPLPK